MAPLQPQGGHFGLILPLCTSSATVGLGLFQYSTLFSFLQPRPSIAGTPLQKHREAMVTLGAPLLATVAATSAISGIFCSRWLKTHLTLETTSVSNWYLYGSALAFGHFAFQPFISGVNQRMAQASKEDTAKTEDELDELNRKEMGTWLTIHTIRTLLVDIPALWCFAEGAAQAFWVI